MKMKTRFYTFVLFILLIMGMSNFAFAVSLTSITLDPEDSTGTTTNAPGAWSTNTADPLSQVGVMSDGAFLNQGSESGTLGEISIPLKPGINTFTLFGNMTLPGNAFYGAILFFDGVQTPPQVAVYNANGTLGSFLVQPAGTTIMGGANGGLFFDKAPGTSVYIAPDGTKVEVLSFVINSMSSNIDKISFAQIGPNGTPDTTAQLILNVTPPPPGDIFGCIELKGLPVIGSNVLLQQPKKPIQITETDAEGCYKFDNVVSGKTFILTIQGPRVP